VHLAIREHQGHLGVMDMDMGHLAILEGMDSDMDTKVKKKFDRLKDKNILSSKIM
jgi:hypothetical protein